MGEKNLAGFGRVAAVVVTYNRCDVLRKCLTGLEGQARPLDEIIVIDNASSDGTADMVTAEFPSVHLVRMTSDTGAAGGFAAGLRETVERGHDWAWVFNDDDVADPDALKAMFDTADGLSARTGIVGCGRRSDSGKPYLEGSCWKNRFVPLPPIDPDGALLPVDVLAFSGTLVATALVRDVGVPRTEYFMMIEELEYCLRARRAGWHIYVLPQPLVVSLTLGSVAGESPPWRGYYQTRNQLAMSLEHRSVPELWWWAVRNARFAAAALRSSDRRAERLRLRALGAWHGLRGVSGRTVAPPEDEDTAP